MEELDVGTRRFAVGLKKDGTISSYAFAEGKWGPFGNQVGDAQNLVTTLASGERGIFLRTNDGKIIPYDPLRRVYGQPLANKWPAELISAASVNGHMLALRSNASVYIYNGQQWTELPVLKNIAISQMVSSPVYDAFVVEQ